MEAVQKTPEREAFYRKIDGENLSALWNVMGELITPEPKSACRPHLWRFDAIRDYMTEAGKLITAKEAERRVLVLENPGLRGQSAAFRPRGQGRLYRRRWRAHRDGARRFCHYAVDDVA